MDGICLGSVKLREFLTQPPSLSTPVQTQTLYTVLLSNFIRKSNDPEVIVDGFSDLISATQNNVTIEELLNDSVKSHIDEKIEDIKEHVNEQCSSEDDPIRRQLFDQQLRNNGKRGTRSSQEENTAKFVVQPDQAINEETTAGDRTRKKDVDEKVSEFLNSDPVMNIKRRAAKQLGMSSQNVDKTFNIFRDAFGRDVAHEEKIKEKIMSDPTIANDLQKMFIDEVRNNPKKYEKEVTGRLLKNAINPETGLFEKERLKNIHSALASIQEGKLDATRNLEGGLEDQCNGFLNLGKSIIKAHMTSVLNDLVDRIQNSGVFSKNQQGDSEYDLGFVEDLMYVPVGFVKIMDPFQEFSFLYDELRNVIKVCTIDFHSHLDAVLNACISYLSFLFERHFKLSLDSCSLVVMLRQIQNAGHYHH